MLPWRRLEGCAGAGAGGKTLAPVCAGQSSYCTLVSECIRSLSTSLQLLRLAESWGRKPRYAQAVCAPARTGDAAELEQPVRACIAWGASSLTARAWRSVSPPPPSSDGCILALSSSTSISPGIASCQDVWVWGGASRLEGSSPPAAAGERSSMVLFISA